MIAGLVVAVLVGAVILRAIQTGSSSHAAATPPPSPAQTRSPHEVCVAQLLAVASDIADNGDAGSQAEITVNGGTDPFFQTGASLAVTYISSSYSVGKTHAAQQARAVAENDCSGQLGDAIRPNYPTDGTFPQVSTSGSGGSQTNPCPMNWAPSTDDAGNPDCVQGDQTMPQGQY